LEGQIRTVEAAIENLIGQKIIPRGNCLLAWLIEWCSTILNRCSKGEDGRTPYQRIRGKESHRPVCQFGEKLLWKPFETAADRKENDEVVCQEGCWLRIVDRTDEAIVGTPRRVVRCCDVRRRPVEERGDPEGLVSVVGWPSTPTPGKSPNA
jgi:hypothetical protein